MAPGAWGSFGKQGRQRSLRSLETAQEMFSPPSSLPGFPRNVPPAVHVLLCPQHSHRSPGGVVSVLRGV